jgi:hypothetical protein
MEGLTVLKTEERDKIITQTKAYEASVYFKFANTGVYKTKATQSGSRRVLSCKRPSALPMTLSNKPVTLNFVLNSEVYFLVTIVSIDQKGIHFNVDTDVFHLARRKNRRLKIPKDYEANLMIKRMSGQMAFLRGIIIDISTGGCRLALNTDVPLIESNFNLEGTLKIGGRQPIDVQGLVRYHRLYVRKDHKQIFGVQFTDLNSYAESRIQATILDLQRELFLKVLE